MLRFLLAAKHGWLVFVLALAAGYVVSPLVAAYIVGPGYFELVARMGAVSCLSIAIGAHLPVLDSLGSRRVPRIALPATALWLLAWLPFFIFAFMAWGTAEKIPVIASLQGADRDTVAVLREQFLKARTGWQSGFVYVNAMMTGAILPYAIASMFLARSSWRWPVVGFFLVFATSFTEKAFFLKAAVPLLYLASTGTLGQRFSTGRIVTATLAVLLAVTFAARSGTPGEADLIGDFFSTQYATGGPIGHLIWRAFAVPVVTAGDSLRVFLEDFGGRNFNGATSSFLAALLGQERVEFERLVFAAQWGQNPTGTGSSNSVYFIEAFINWGWPGVVVISGVIGLLLRSFARSNDEAYRAVWPLLCFGLYNAGFIGKMLSNGFILLFLMALAVRVVNNRLPTAGGVAPSTPVPTPLGLST
jgi:hypothetical protein